VRSEGFYVNEKFQWHQLGSNQRQHLNHCASAAPTVLYIYIYIYICMCVCVGFCSLCKMYKTIEDGTDVPKQVVVATDHTDVPVTFAFVWSYWCARYLCICMIILMCPLPLHLYGCMNEYFNQTARNIWFQNGTEHSGPIRGRDLFTSWGTANFSERTSARWSGFRSRRNHVTPARKASNGTWTEPERNESSFP